MAHRHHHHGPGEGLAHEQRLFRVMLLTGGFMLVEALGGWLSGSLALIADAGHMLTDTLALALAWLGFLVGRRGADPQRSFGYRRFEVLAAWVNGLMLMGLTVWIMIEAVARLLAPVPVMGWPMLAVAILGLLVNLVALYVLHRGGGDNLNLRGAALHVLGDLLGSVGAIIAALVILWTGWMPIDPILSVFVAVLILRSAWSLVKQSTHILLEGTPEGLDVNVLRADLEAVHAEIADVHHVHAWSLNGGQALLTLHVRLHSGASSRGLLGRIKRTLAERYAVRHSVIQLESPEAPCPDQRLQSRP
ncbi:cation diffusion facilitator family transporter [Alkalilimnicola sp. S0819]|uniref:cation diffusion facilitator family transporter n=1 Tax=Alkalilimnicola sp. S0819 TaxID=2613922 RepID=UPI001261D6A4|nr:cation diffusion facilitator family transporter [Alkalilimnicola sp. S0819]KAB7623637.1 cation transporter [Alkalilimnicola sp. S0819]MPQ16761.1 cation diffusion facilitator family transporter [Alkalilimnicola sp. S0819]